ncbi:DUF1634 domain-containing protein [Acidianus sp. HS-5]|uniref:DUF1634 domain-containing protein n=1 Tax=Acidianus sp. HS-5 TaxID=2886040 RepID=UPI001F44A131|nr:DUF1634 domain-containing protein [Acidianus sp. HS-5]BDC17279.1 membrane protein [Acidianus sp. HS-5]
MDMNDVIGYTLRIGVIISISLIVIGFVLLSTSPQFSELMSPNSRFNTSIVKPEEVFRGIKKGNGVDFILLGLMVLIATPVARVVMGIIQFAMQKNTIYVIVTLIVLFNLLLAIFILPLII